MRLICYYDNDGTRVGEVSDDEVVTPLEGIRAIDASTSPEAIAGAARDRDRQFSLHERRLAPVASPRRIVCVGLNYHAHVDETKRELPTYPVLFTKFASTLIGAYDDIALPPESSHVDYEGELAVVIGRPGRRIAPADANTHILGFAAANDITMRDYQYKSHQWLQGKAWDASTPVGPFLVSPDEVALESQTLTTTLNGDVVQSSTLDRLIFPIPALISYISEFTRLETGDLILTGTPGGVGFRRNPQVFLQPGDRVTVEISGVGAVRNAVTSAADDPAEPPAAPQSSVATTIGTSL